MFKMEKHFQRQDSNLQFNRNVPGCFWSILHTLDYHPWHNVKKMLPYRKHSRSKEDPKTTLSNLHIAEVPEHFSDEKCSTESVPIDKRPGEAHMNVLLTKKMSKGENKYWKLNFKSKRRLHRTFSIHHLEPSYNFPGNDSEVGDDAVASPKDDANHSMTSVGTSLQKTPKKLAAARKKCNSLDTNNTENYFGHGKTGIQSTPFSEISNGVEETTNEINRDISSHSLKEDADILEIYKANKKLFAELLQGSDGNHNFQSLQKSKIKVGLAKSKSFPSAGLARNRYRKLSSLQHKQIESFPKGQKSVSGPQPSKLAESGSPTNSPTKLTPYESTSTSCHNKEQQTNSSSLGPNHGLKHGGWNQLVIKRFNFIKQKIRHTFRESKKQNNQKAAKEIPSTVLSEHKLSLDRKETQENFGISRGGDGTGIIGFNETDSFDNGKINDGVQTMTKITSQNASLERYAQLFEYGSNRNRAKCHHSQSLKQTSEDKNLKSENARKSFKRNLSMPDLDLFCSLFNDPPREVYHTAQPIRALVDPDTDNNIHTDPNSAPQLASVDRSKPLDGESQNMIENGDHNMPVEHSDSLNMAENDTTACPDELNGKITERDILESKHHQVLESDCRFDDVSELSQDDQILDLEICFQDDATCFLKVPNSKELNPECSFGNELEPSDDLPNKSSTESLPETMVDHDVVDDIENIYSTLYLHSDINSINNADFNYMRYILQLSSFIERDHSIDQPLNPSLFDGLEACFYNKLESYWKKVDKNSEHQLLLDLVYETLHDVFERSFIYFIKAHSLKCQIHPMPLGQFLLEEVREKVAWYLCLGPELDQSLDDVVGRDLRKGDDWMNLQSEKESLALEMEDFIFDELLDEVIFC